MIGFQGSGVGDHHHPLPAPINRGFCQGAQFVLARWQQRPDPTLLIQTWQSTHSGTPLMPQQHPRISLGSQTAVAAKISPKRSHHQGRNHRPIVAVARKEHQRISVSRKGMHHH